MSLLILNLNPGYDRWIIFSKEPELKKVQRGDKVVSYCAGKGLNMSRVLKSLGYEDYRCINIIGGHVGSIIRLKSTEEGLNPVFWGISDESRVNTALVYENRKEMIMINEPGPFMSRDEVESFKEFFNTTLKKEHEVVLSGSAPRGFEAEDIFQMLHSAKKSGAKVYVDIAGRWLEKAALTSPDLIKVNNDEFINAFGIDGSDIPKVSAFRKEHSIKELIITFGKEGCIAYADKIFKAVPKKTYSDFAVGSGDSFFAGYLFESKRTADIKTRLITATACAVANTLRYGAGFFNLDEYEQQKQNVEVTEV